MGVTYQKEDGLNVSLLKRWLTSYFAIGLKCSVACKSKRVSSTVVHFFYYSKSEDFGWAGCLG